MDNDIITLIDKKDQKHKYKVLLTIDDKYILYTDINNYDINKDIYAIKVENLDNKTHILSINDEDLKTINKNYTSITK